MNAFSRILLLSAFCAVIPATGWSAEADPYTQGEELYKAGRNSEAMDAFEMAVKKKVKAKDAQAYIERIRRETVERIRNKALTGVSKANWQSKFYFMNVVDDKVLVGISVQETFERDSTHFRPGALDGLAQLAQALNKAVNRQVRVELITEVNQASQPDKAVLAQQLTAVFSYLSLSTRSQLPTY